MYKHYFLLLLFVCASVAAMACKCAPMRLADNFQRAGFVATAKIIDVTPDSLDSKYHDAEIEVINLYKGKSLKRIKIFSRGGSCYFLPKKQTTWLIFATEFQGKLSFGFCSGSQHLDLFDPVKEPGLYKKYRSSNELKLEAVEYLKRHNVFSSSLGNIFTWNDQLPSINGFKAKQRIAVFQIELATDFSVTAVKQLEKFGNAALDIAVLNSMRTNLKFSNTEKAYLDKPISYLVVCYYYPGEDGRSSFISLYDG